MNMFLYYKHVLASYIVTREIEPVYKAFNFYSVQGKTSAKIKAILKSLKRDILRTWGEPKKPYYQKAISELLQLQRDTQVRRIYLK